MTNNWRSKRTFLSLSLSDNQTNKLQNTIIHNMNNIQVSLKADNQNGILSIQGVDLFSIIDTDWNWNNISFIQDSCVRAFFIRAKKLLNNNIAAAEEDNQVFNDASKNSEEINSYYEKEFGYSEWILPEMEDYGGSRNLVGIIVSYSHPKFRPLPHGNKSIGGVGSHRASL